MCLKDGRVVGWTSSSYMDQCTFIAGSQIGHSVATPRLAPPLRSQSPFPSYKFSSALSFRLD